MLFCRAMTKLFESCFGFFLLMELPLFLNVMYSIYSSEIQLFGNNTLKRVPSVRACASA